MPSFEGAGDREYSGDDGQGHARGGDGASRVTG